MEKIETLRKQLLDVFPVRKTAAQKQAFREWLNRQLRKMGYSVEVETYGMGTNNVIAGRPETAELVFTAHYDTGPRGIGFVSPTNLLLSVLIPVATVLMMAAAAFVLSVLPTFLINAPGATVPLFVALMFFGLWMMVRGPANPNNANSNTSGVLTVLSIAQALPKPLRKHVAFVFFDNSEAGMAGASKYKKKHSAEIGSQVFFNFDCVGDGDYILLMPSKKSRWDGQLLDNLEQCYQPVGEKVVRQTIEGLVYYPSDHRKFAFHVAVGAFHRKKGVGYYLSRIHTPKDTELDETNIMLLRDGTVRLIEAYYNEKTGDKKDADL
ncbi:M28 family peptidase [Oscillibacter sp. MSJ-2]|uniref:M28 family peptidase n=1 Tax=Dysosmobacter acutus TaxID=2841504 RepID=A0ABS6FA74_9FIRM|nr:M28 family peptidase [Dysosmobacter acutus]MBU5627198.1 M28 family peptidase [Dysosmobacter acutus]